MTSDNISINSNNFSVDKYGNMICYNADIRGGNINMVGDNTSPTITIIDGITDGDIIEMYPSNFYMSYWYPGDDCVVSQFLQKSGYYVVNEYTGQSTSVDYYGIRTPSVTQTSKEEDKKNFEKFENALEIIKNIDIYKYNLKQEQDGTKKHIGFVIGDKYNYSEEVTSKDNDGVDIYSFVSLCCEAIKEQQEEIELLKEEIKILKEGGK